MKALLRDSAFYLPAQLLPAVLGFVALPILTRFLDPAQFGNYALVKAAVLVLLFATGWVTSALIRFYPAYEKEGRTGTLYVSAMAGTLATAALAATAFALALPLWVHDKNLQRLFAIGLVLYVCTALWRMLQAMLRAERKPLSYSISTTWKATIEFAVGIALLALWQAGPEAMLMGSLAAVVLGLPWLWRRTRPRGTSASVFAWPCAREMLFYGFPVVFGGISAWILSLSDRYVLKLYLSSADVGVYSSGYMIADSAIMALISLFHLADRPLAMRTWESEGAAEASAFMSRLVRLYLLATLPAAVGLSLLSRPLVLLLLGPEFRSSYTVIPPVAAGLFLFGLAQREQLPLLFRKKLYVVSLCTVVSGAVSLGLNFALVPRFGYVTAAWTTLVAYTTMFVFIRICARAQLAWRFPYRSLRNCLCAVAAMGLVVAGAAYATPWSPALKVVSGIVSGVVVYAAMLLAVGEVSLAELQGMCTRTAFTHGKGA